MASANPIGAQQAQAAQHQAQTDEPVTKFKVLLPRFRDSAASLFKAAGASLVAQNSQSDPKSNEVQQHKFDKNLEEFYAISDQMEISLRLALEILQQNSDSGKHTQVPVLNPTKADGSQGQEGHLYPQYLGVVRSQIACARDIIELLHEFTKKLGESSQERP